MTKDNVIRLQREQQTEKKEKTPEQLLKEVKKDMGKVALIISIMAVMLMVVLFFSTKLTVNAIEKKVAELYPVKNQVIVLDKAVSGLETRLAKIEKLPEETRKMIYGNILSEMTQKVEYLSSHVKGADKEKLIQIKRLLEDIERNMK